MTRPSVAFALLLCSASPLFAQTTGTLTGVLTGEQPGPALRGIYEFAIVGTSCEAVRSRESLIVEVCNP